MKRSRILVLSLLLLFVLTACGETVPSVEENPQNAEENLSEKKEQLSLSLKTTGYSMDFEEKGVLLAELRLSYPKLVVVTESGEEYIGPETETVDGVTRYLDEVRVAKNFNAKMEAEMEAQKEEFTTLCNGAQEHYQSLDEVQRKYWGNYALDISCSSFRSENLISTVGAGYWYAGGAHPSSFHQTWNFDLTTGEFFTLDDLADDAEAIRNVVADEIMRQIYAEELHYGFFEDYESTVRGLACTHMSFDKTGMVVRFDLYAIAPYAAGIPEFFVGYEMFREHLNEHGREVLPIPQEA